MWRGLQRLLSELGAHQSGVGKKDTTTYGTSSTNHGCVGLGIHIAKGHASFRGRWCAASDLATNPDQQEPTISILVGITTYAHHSLVESRRGFRA